MTANLIQFAAREPGAKRRNTRESRTERAERAELHRLLDEILDDRNHEHPQVRANVNYLIDVFVGSCGRGMGVWGCNDGLKNSRDLFSREDYLQKVKLLHDKYFHLYRYWHEHGTAESNPRGPKG
jgi:hypothetical protein